MTPSGERTLLIACGALARECLALKTANGWTHLDIACVPAILHNRPHEIPDAVRRRIRMARADYDHILCLYGDCGTGGLLDAMLEEEQVERINGPHCYSFYAGADHFDAMMEDEVGTFFLTDFLVRHFDRLVWKGLGLDRHPELLADYFAHYRRVLYLAQAPTEALRAKASRAAQRLGLPLAIVETGLSGVGDFLASRLAQPHA